MTAPDTLRRRRPPRGSDVAGADSTEADLEHTVLKDAKGLAKGLDKAPNRDRAVN